MATRRSTLSIVAILFLVVACGEPPADPTGITPSFDRDGEAHTVVVNPNANGNGIAATIQEGIDMVEPGGKVLVKPGTYAEAVVIDKGLTLEAIGDGSERVIIERITSGTGPPIQVLTSQAVQLRGITIRHVNVQGSRPDPSAGQPDGHFGHGRLTLPLNHGRGLNMSHNTVQSGGRSRLVVRDSRRRRVSHAPVRRRGRADRGQRV
jgi:hypothetical protein